MGVVPRKSRAQISHSRGGGGGEVPRFVGPLPVCRGALTFRLTISRGLPKSSPASPLLRISSPRQSSCLFRKTVYDMTRQTFRIPSWLSRAFLQARIVRSSRGPSPTYPSPAPLLASWNFMTTAVRGIAVAQDNDRFLRKSRRKRITLAWARR